MKKPLLALVVLVLTLFVLEGLSGLILLVATKGPAETMARRAERAGRTEGAGSPPEFIAAGRSDTQEYLIHPYLGFTYGDRTNPTVNAHGFIGPDLLAHGGDAEFNVVVTGGSVAGNFHVLCWDGLRRDLAGLPLVRGRTVNVFSLAVAGYKEPQQLLAVAYFLARGAKIDLLVNIDGFNESVMPFMDNLPSGVAPLYPLFWADLTEAFADAEKRKLLGRLALFDASRRTLARLADIPPLRWSLTATLAWNLLDGLLEGRERLALAGLEAAAAGQRPPPAGADLDLSPERVLDLTADAWMRSSLLLDRMARAGGFAYVHVLQPNQYPEGAKPLTPAERRNALSPDPAFAARVRAGYAALAPRVPELRRAGVAVLDATMLFADQDRDLYIDACCHFNEPGNRILLDRLVAFIAALPLPGAPAAAEASR